MPKPKRTTNRKTKSTRKENRPDQEFGMDQQTMEEPADEFVSDAEIEARERGHLKPKGHKKGR